MSPLSHKKDCVISKSCFISYNEWTLRHFTLHDVKNLQFELRSSLCSVIGLIEIINDKSESFDSEDEFTDCINKIYLSRVSNYR